MFCTMVGTIWCCYQLGAFAQVNDLKTGRKKLASYLFGSTRASGDLESCILHSQFSHLDIVSCYCLFGICHSFLLLVINNISEVAC